MTILLTILLSALSFATEKSLPVDAIKLIDGKIAHCEAESDLGVVGYRPNLPVVISENGALRLSFGVFGVACAKDEEGFAWSLRPINDPFFTTALNGEPVENFILKNEAVVTDRNYTKVFGSQELENRGMQVVNIPLAQEDILSPAQRQALDEGHAVSVRVHYFNRMVNEYVYRGRRTKGRLMIGGAYSFAFTLVKENGAIKSTAVSVL
jgi:hypothetical protein